MLIPHRRGEDGYFMLQYPPARRSRRRRRSITVCREYRATMAQRGPGQRRADGVANPGRHVGFDGRGQPQGADGTGRGHSGSLGAKDKFNLATCDVDCRWLLAHPEAADAKNVRLAGELLAARTSLGWTDLDLAMASALKQCGPKTHVIYIGDGIVTAGDADPVAFAKRLRRMAEGKANTFHAVAVGSSFESGVLRAIASLGGGSLRRVTQGHGPRGWPANCSRK